MAQTLVRIVYDAQTHQPKRFIIPDEDYQLDRYHPHFEGEDHLDVTNEQYQSMAAPAGPHLDIVTAFIKKTVNK